MSIIKTVVPDIILKSQDKFKDTLEITMFDNRIEFTANIDNCGNTFILKKELLKFFL